MKKGGKNSGKSYPSPEERERALALLDEETSWDGGPLAPDDTIRCRRYSLREVAAKAGIKMGVLNQIIRHTTENLVWLPLYWRVLPTLMNGRISNVSVTSEGTDQWWNAHLWDVS